MYLDCSAEGQTDDPWGWRVLFIVCALSSNPTRSDSPSAWALSLVFFHAEYEMLTSNYAIRYARNEDDDRNEPAGSLRTDQIERLTGLVPYPAKPIDRRVLALHGTHQYELLSFPCEQLKALICRCRPAVVAMSLPPWIVGWD